MFQDFEGKFERGECPGWAREQAGAMAHTGAHLDLSAFSSHEELAKLGLDRSVMLIIVFEQPYVCIKRKMLEKVNMNIVLYCIYLQN